MCELFQDCQFGSQEFEEKYLDDIQYLEFEIDSKAFYICLIQGVDDSYCILRVLPLGKGYSGEGCVITKETIMINTRAYCLKFNEKKKIEKIKYEKI